MRSPRTTSVRILYVGSCFTIARPAGRKPLRIGLAQNNLAVDSICANVHVGEHCVRRSANLSFGSDTEGPRIWPQGGTMPEIAEPETSARSIEATLNYFLDT